GLLTCASGHFLELLGVRNGAEFVGGIFGLVLVSYAWIFRSFRSLWRSLAFIACCTLAYLFAVEAALSTPSFPAFLFPFVDPCLVRELEICFIGGIVGGALVFLSSVMFLPNRAQWKHVPLNISVFCASSRILVLLAWLPVPS